MKVTTGVQQKPLRAVAYGPEGIGKSTLASHWPKPLFLDVEGSTAEMDVARIEKPTSWVELKSICSLLSKDMKEYHTLVIDTADWAERMAKDAICQEAKVQAIGDVPYGKLYANLAAEWGSFLDILSRVAERANVVVLAHSQLSHCEIPEESGAFDRYEMKLLNSFKVNLSSMLKEWASLVMFLNYETFVTDGKASGGQRVAYTTHHTCWDAKQRQGMNLPEKMVLPADGTLPKELRALLSRLPAATVTKPDPKPITKPAKEKATEPKDEPKDELSGLPEIEPEKAELLLQLRGLCETNKVSTKELTSEMERKGVCPAGTLPPAWHIDTLRRVIANWDKVLSNIENIIRKG